jgi:hypothetical protein
LAEQVDNRISVSFAPGFNPSSRYYFRPWGRTSQGHFYGNVVALDSIVANPNGSGCPLRRNMLEYGSDTKRIYSYASVSPLEKKNGILQIDAGTNAGIRINVFLGGAALKEGTYTIIQSSPQNDGEANFGIEEKEKDFHSVHYSILDVGNTITVTRLTEGVYEITACDAIWHYSFSPVPYKLSTRFIVHT